MNVKLLEILQHKKHWNVSLLSFRKNMWQVLVFVSIFYGCLAGDLIVNLDDGQVQGTSFNTTYGKVFYTWKHIPYAKPPLGNLRYMPPEKPDNWTGVLDGSEDAPGCLSANVFPGMTGPTNGYSEDCLYVNVYSPIEPTSSALNLSVMFWIYGGGFSSGAGDFSSYDPTPLLEEDVIVVTFNYRLGVFGLLSTGDDVVPGNAALKDQLAALTWTKNNIAAFGGNPDDITIFGESAGAMSVGYLLVSPKSKGLFKAAIMQSGTSLKFTLQTSPWSNALGLAAQLNSSISNSSSSLDVLVALQAADANELLNKTASADVSDSKFMPLLEVENPTALVTEPFYESIEAGNFSQVPIIIGTNSEEEMMFVTDLASAQELAASYDSNEQLLLPVMTLKEGVDASVITSEIKRFYTNNGSFIDNPGVILQLLSDSEFRRPSLKHAVLQANYTSVYMYKFSFVGTISKNHPEIPGCGRVGHGEEVGYFFNSSHSPLETDEDFITRKKVVKLWTNFVKTKNPTPPNDDSGVLGNLTWTRFDPAKLNYLDIDEDLEVKSNFRAEQAAFWSYLWDTYAVRPYNTF